MFIYYGASTEWVYSVLDWDKPASLGLYVFLPFALFISFVIWCACLPGHADLLDSNFSMLVLMGDNVLVYTYTCESPCWRGVV